ncbi:MAG: hypothetical protein KDC48_17910, partial [Planctomycetes bacterium]|nr:hypothetical protein [Planctomycetota bacterium]
RARSEVVLFGGEVGTFSFANDTWVFDGTDWHQRFPATSPSPRCCAPMVYDSARNRTVLFGGHIWISLPTNNPFNDTWEWDGTTWTQAQVSAPPPTGQETRMTYDESRQRVTMFHSSAYFLSQFSSQVYVYDGVSWQATGTPGGLLPRSFASYVYDPGRQTSVLFGGQPYGGTVAFDTWEWAGAGWSPIPVRPTACARTGELLLDPGSLRPIQVDLDPTTGGGMFAWDGVTWQQVGGALPPGRYQAATCVGPLYSYVHGGDTYQGVRNDTWGYDGNVWQLLSTNGLATYASGIAYDYGRSRLVMFGGKLNGTTLHQETWTFDGASWQQALPTNVPQPREAPLLAYDFLRGQVVMHGGRDANYQRLSDTWQWDGTNWTPVVSAANPTGERLAFDAQRARLVLLSPGPTPTSTEAWTLEATGWQSLPTIARSLPAWGEVGFNAVGFPYPYGMLLKHDFDLYSLSTSEAGSVDYGTACTASAPRLVTNGWPRLPTPDLRVEVLGGPASSLIALLGATQAASVPIQGCALLVDPSGAVVLMPTNQAGFASTPLPIPGAPTLLGLDLFFQAACLDPTAPAGFTTSRGRRLTLGT